MARRITELTADEACERCRRVSGRITVRGLEGIYEWICLRCKRRSDTPEPETLAR